MDNKSKIQRYHGFRNASKFKENKITPRKTMEDIMGEKSEKHIFGETAKKTVFEKTAKDRRKSNTRRVKT